MRDYQVLSVYSFSVFLALLIIQVVLCWFYDNLMVLSKCTSLRKQQKVVWFVLSCEGLTADAGILISPV